MVPSPTSTDVPVAHLSQLPHLERGGQSHQHACSPMLLFPPQELILKKQVRTCPQRRDHEGLPLDLSRRGEKRKPLSRRNLTMGPLLSSSVS